jgi:hypothetical protein
MIEDKNISKKDEIMTITNELKSHYYKNDFFVDPDKKFINLMQKITVKKYHSIIDFSSLKNLINNIDIFKRKYYFNNRKIYNIIY